MSCCNLLTLSWILTDKKKIVLSSCHISVYVILTEQIKSEVQRQREFISFLIKEVESATYADISEVEAFVKWLDGELSSLVDERSVLKHFPLWPEQKTDALREASCNYRNLKSLESEVSSFENNPKEPLAQALKKMQALQDRRACAKLECSVA